MCKNAESLAALTYARKSILFDASTKEIKRSNLVLLNGQPYINLGKRLDTELKDGDEITFSAVLAGG